MCALFGAEQILYRDFKGGNVCAAGHKGDAKAGMSSVEPRGAAELLIIQVFPHSLIPIRQTLDATCVIHG